MKSSILISALTLAGCSTYSLEGKQSTQTDGLRAGGAAGSDSDAAASSLQGDATQPASQDEASPSEQAVLGTLIALSKQLDLDIATCAGFGDEAKALQDALDSLRGTKVDRETARTLLEPLHEALRAKTEQSQEALAGCVELSRESTEAVALNTLIEACFDKPEGRGEGRGPGRHGAAGMKGGHDPGLHGALPPPPAGAREESAPGLDRGPGSQDAAGMAGEGRGPGGHGRMPPPPRPTGAADGRDFGPGPRPDHSDEATAIDGTHGGAGPGGMPPMAPHLRLPPKEAAKFDSDACKAALSTVQDSAG